MDERKERLKAQLDRFKHIIRLVEAIPDAVKDVEFPDIRERMDAYDTENLLIDNYDISDANIDIIIAFGEKKIQIYEDYLKRINEYMEQQNENQTV